MQKITFILGGEKSGKSAFALKEAKRLKGKRAFIATAEIIDEEMEKRIERHRIEREGSFETFEEPLNLCEILEKVKKDYDVIIVDCLTLWVSNLLYYGKEVEREFERLLETLKGMDGNLFLVSNEVGLGIVPETEVGRKFRFYLGILNSEIASLAERVIFMISGIPLNIKGGGKDEV